MSWPDSSGFGLTTGLCDGNDRHWLGPPPSRLAAGFCAGAALVVAGALVGRAGVPMLVYGATIVSGVLLALLFASWVSGPYVHYLVWGRPRTLCLADVTEVTPVNPARGVGRAQRLQAVALVTPLRAKPLPMRVGRGAASSAAWAHFQHWLAPPRVHWDPAASAVLASAPPRARLPAWVRVLGYLAPSMIAAVVLTVMLASAYARYDIPGAPGYRTFSGPNGLALVVGAPWGSPCRPIVFQVEPNVPLPVYEQFARTVTEARRAGIDVTVETRALHWHPGALYYRPGQSTATATVVPVYANYTEPPLAPDGQPEHLDLQWNAGPDATGRRDILTGADGVLWVLPSVTTPMAVRRSTRQLIAFTQGIWPASYASSGIADGSRTDRFTRRDIAAMLLMSGCGTRRA